MPRLFDAIGESSSSHTIKKLLIRKDDGDFSILASAVNSAFFDGKEDFHTQLVSRMIVDMYYCLNALRTGNMPPKG